MGKVDFRYYVSDERLIAYSKVPLLDRLKWLDEIVRFTLMMREAPTTTAATASRNAAKVADASKENN
jgi:hypothetical protein